MASRRMVALGNSTLKAWAVARPPRPARAALVMNQPKYETKKKRPRECWTKANFKPIPGRMIIFPAWLYHGVASNLSKEIGRAADRIIISFNVNQVKK